MTGDECFIRLCFNPMLPGSPRFFGFAELLAGLALMVLAWTTADFRYKFRIETAPIDLRALTFWIVLVVGSLSLLTDIWRIQLWPVLDLPLLTAAVWQGLLGSAFFFLFILWSWFSFIKPSSFGQMNSVQYIRTVYGIILRGSPSELAVVADELERSIHRIIECAPVHPRYAKEDDPIQSLPAYVAAADAFLLLLGDRRFCRSVAEKSPLFALALFEEISQTKKYDVNVRVFVRNFIDASFENRDSFLYHETEGYLSGLVGFEKPFSTLIFSNYDLVDRVDVLDVDYRSRNTWDVDQWEAYCRVSLLTFSAFAVARNQNRSSSLYRALENITDSTHAIYKLNDDAISYYDTDIYRKSAIAIGFIVDAINIFNKHPLRYAPLHVAKRHGNVSILHHLANSACEIIFHASKVRSTHQHYWPIRHNMVWNRFFEYGIEDGESTRIFQFKLRRLIYNEIKEIGDSPHYKNTAYLSMIFSILGFQPSKDRFSGSVYALHKTTMIWVKKNYSWLYFNYPELSENILVDRLSFDEKSSRLVLTAPANVFDRVAHVSYFSVDRWVASKSEVLVDPVSA